jgi:hypothetical protein
MKFKTELDFIDNFNKTKKEIVQNILDELPIIEEVNQSDNLLNVVKKNDLNGKWNKETKLGRSLNLESLSEKIRHMILYIGCPNSVRPMLESICKNKIKKLSKDNGRYDNDFLGFGHFRWDYKAITLSENEIKRVKEYFKI